MKIKAVFSLLLFLSFNSHAGYAYPKPPPTWRPNPSGVGGLYKSPRFAQRDASNNNWYTDVAELYLPGAGNIKYPVSMREASNAANYLAKNSFLPFTLGTAALALMAEWLSQAGLQTWIDPSTGQQVWAKPTTQASTDGYEYIVGSTQWFPTKQQACQAAALVYIIDPLFSLLSAVPSGSLCIINFKMGDTPHTASPQISSRPSPCPIGWISTPAGCITPSMRPVTQPEFEDDLSPLKIPVELPPLLPFPLPVDDPVTNPKPFPFGDPQPWFSPSGDPYPAPQPRPEPDPYPWLEPGYDVVPSPKPAPDPDPWRLNPKPVQKPKPDPSPTPNPNPTPTPTPNPSPTPTPNPTPTPTPTPEKDPGLCALFPDILACEKLGEAPDAPELDNENKETPLTRQDGFGASNGSCPADKQITLSAGLVLKMPFTVICDFASKIRPLVLAFASLSAAFIFVGAMKNK